MDNLGDWIYIVFLVIAGLSGLISSARKKKQEAENSVPPVYESDTPDSPDSEKGFWEIFDEMQKEQQKPVEAPKPPARKKVKKQKSTTTPFLTAESQIHSTISSSISSTSSSLLVSEEEVHGMHIDQDFRNAEELRKAVIYTEILNRKY